MCFYFSIIHLFTSMSILKDSVCVDTFSHTRNACICAIWILFVPLCIHFKLLLSLVVCRCVWGISYPESKGDDGDRYAVDAEKYNHQNPNPEKWVITFFMVDSSTILMVSWKKQIHSSVYVTACTQMYRCALGPLHLFGIFTLPTCMRILKSLCTFIEGGGNMDLPSHL